MYVAVKGGEKAIANSLKILAEKRRGDPAVPEVSLRQIREQMPLGVDRVMAEGSLYDPELAALALKQAMGDQMEAVFLLRAYRTTLPRFGYTTPVDTSRMAAQRRISAMFKDIPGGQILGPTFDYTHRLLDFSLADAAEEPAPEAATCEGAEGPGEGPDPAAESEPPAATCEGAEGPPRAAAILEREGLLETEEPGDDSRVGDVTRDPITFPTGRDVRLQSLARADEGFLLALAYSTQRGFGSTHPFAGEIRMGEVTVEFVPAELGFPVELGEILVTECEMVNQFKGSKDVPPQFTRGYGLAFGCSERKAMSMALVDRALRCREYGQEPLAPAQDEEFVLSHADNVAAQGFVSHLKLPHYVDFQGELTMVRAMRAAARAAKERPDPAEGKAEAEKETQDDEN